MTGLGSFGSQYEKYCYKSEYNTYDENTASELERRFLNSIKSGDPRKFKRGIQKIIEGKKNVSK